METKKEFIREYKKDHPVGQATHTGKWGYGRYLDGLDLRCCKYRKQHDAVTARDEAAENAYDLYAEGMRQKEILRILQQQNADENELYEVWRDIMYNPYVTFDCSG